MNLKYFSSDRADAWDAFVKSAPNATLLHRRSFLSYHGNRFLDRSVMVFDDNDHTILGCFPAAEDPADPTSIVSHPGATFGGMIWARGLGGEKLVTAMREMASFYAESGYKRLIYKAVPVIYHSRPCQDDLYALFRLNAHRFRCDLSASIDLSNRGKVSSRRKRGLKKALSSGVSTSTGVQHIDDLWRVLEENLKEKHNTKPVHTLDEIRLLEERHPDEIEFLVAKKDDRVIAGTVLFLNSVTCHAQYIASNEMGHACSALDMVFEEAIKLSADRGMGFFDFGISNENHGRYLNEGLHKFKTEFGAGGVVHEFFEIPLADL